MITLFIGTIFISVSLGYLIGRTHNIQKSSRFDFIYQKAKLEVKNTSTKELLQSYSYETLIQIKKSALIEENYELAAIVEYYLNFKFKPNKDVKHN